MSSQTRTKRGEFTRRKYVPSLNKDKQTKTDIHNVLKNVTSDHTYSYHDNACNDKTLIDCGRLVVELDTLAEGLRGCSACGHHLSLDKVENVVHVGLAATLNIRCEECKALSPVVTGKKHGNVFDVNSKLGTATVHSGLGERQVNSFLTCLNIHPVSHTLIDRRIKETGAVLEKVATESTEAFLKEEVQLQGDGTIGVSVDAGWQKRGSGRSYDSLSGHCTMVGQHTGKVVGFSVRQKTCKTCQVSSDPPIHDCRRNWAGSAKAMEADMVMEMVKTADNKGATVSIITGDEDSSTIAKLRTSVRKDMKKRSDKNHIKKTLCSSLYTLQKQHPTLTQKVIVSLQRNFAYMLSRNQGDPQGILDGLEAQSRHPFGDHSCCEQSWCEMLKNERSKHKSLPFGRPLNNTSLQTALSDLFHGYKKHAEKLSCLGSTQINESMNNIIASKAPKAHHFSGSASLSYRVSAGVAQKNLGHKYLLDVNSKLGLSPGSYTHRLSVLRDIQNSKRRAIAMTAAAKRRRQQLKGKRNKRRNVNEVREGPLYKTNIAMEQGDELPETIPDPIFRPVKSNLASIPENHVYFDIETTGLGRQEHIIQLAAQRDEVTFSCYVKPKKAISRQAKQVTNIDIVGDQMFYKNTAVPSVGIHEALSLFIDFLKEAEGNVLIGHNCKSFDCPILTNALFSCGLFANFCENVAGFADTRLVFSAFKPCTQISLAQHFLKEDYNAHNALADVTMLKRIVNAANVESGEILKASFATKYCADTHNIAMQVTQNLPTVMPLVQSKTISIGMGRRIAGSGLCLSHLRLAWNRNGAAGIEEVFSEESATSSVRVTRSQAIIHAVAKYITDH